VADVLLMSTFKVGNPVEEFVQMKIHNFARDACRFGSRRIHMRATSFILLFLDRITGHLLPVRTSHAAGMKFEPDPAKRVALL
jgi:hypothetical protein